MAVLEVRIEGNKRIVRASFRVPDENGVLTDPTTVTYTARRRGSAANAPAVWAGADTAEISKVSTGVFDFTFEPAEGTWAVYVKSTGAALAAGEIRFIVARAEALV